MGMQYQIELASSAILKWEQVRDLLAEHGITVQMRMIDGGLAFPDEVPPDTWHEIRVAIAGGMVTIHRAPQSVSLVTWGNADPELVAAWNALTWAFAELGNGSIHVEGTLLSPSDFRTQVPFPGQ